MKVLYDAGADIRLGNESYQPVHIAARNGNLLAIEVIANFMSDPINKNVNT